MLIRDASRLIANRDVFVDERVAIEHSPAEGSPSWSGSSLDRNWTGNATSIGAWSNSQRSRTSSFSPAAALESSASANSTMPTDSSVLALTRTVTQPGDDNTDLTTSSPSDEARAETGPSYWRLHGPDLEDLEQSHEMRDSSFADAAAGVNMRLFKVGDAIRGSPVKLCVAKSIENEPHLERT